MGDLEESMSDVEKNENYVEEFCHFIGTIENKINLLEYIIPLICLFGIVGNILNIAIFSRTSSPASIILRALSITELVVVILNFALFIVYCWMTYTESVDEYFFVLGIDHFIRFVITEVFYNIGTWLAIVLAIWRYVAIVYPLHSKSWCNKTRTRIMIVAGYIVGIILHAVILLLCPDVNYLLMDADLSLDIFHLRAWLRLVSSIVLTVPSAM